MYYVQSIANLLTKGGGEWKVGVGLIKVWWISTSLICDHHVQSLQYPKCLFFNIYILIPSTVRSENIECLRIYTNNYAM